jgi:uncharacterized protein YecT (DUF1311 family)
MKYITLLLFSNVLFFQTQIELNFNAKERFELVNKELNSLHNKLLDLNKNNLDKKSEIILSHETWIQQRNSYMNKRYPKNQRKEYGTYFPIRWHNDLIDLTKNRINYIRHKHFTN